MSSSFDLPFVDRFTAGTVGPPGRRIFFLQGEAAGQVVTLRLEKVQVAALADYLADLISELPTAETEVAASADMELSEPVVAEWVVGTLAVAVDESGQRIVIQADELVPEAEDELGGASARFSLDRSQVMAFIVQAATLAVAGRPPCPLCGAPVDPDGHMCAKTNGHKEH
jgi:uncharacterized repeat protein (TIGR03847 family)